MYFHFAADAIRHALATAPIQAHVTRLVLSYGHLLFIAAIVMLSLACMPPSLSRRTTCPRTTPGCCSVAARSTSFRWVLAMAMFHELAGTRFAAAALVLLLWPVAPHVPAVVALLLLAIILAALNLGERMTIKAGRALW